MGTIAEKLQKLLSTKEAIKQAIICKGVSVLDTDTFSSYADKIAEITTGSEATLIEKTIEENGTYNASDDSADGYSSVIVNIPTSDNFVITDAKYLFYISARIELFDILFSKIKNCTSFASTFQNMQEAIKLDVKSILAKCSTEGCICSSMFDSSNSAAYYKIEFSNINEADYSNVTYMNNMFSYCKNIDIDIILKDINKVINMSNIFDNTNIISADLSQANNTVCTNVDYAFRASKITKITFGGLKYQGISAKYVAYGCNKLTEIEWNNLCPSSLRYAFYNCTALKNVDCSNLDGSKLTDVAYMFGNCSNIVEVLNINLNYVTSSANLLLFGATNLSKMKRFTFKTNTTFGKNTVSSEIILNLARLTAFDADGYTEMINTLANNESGYVRTIKLNTTLYNSLSDEQKALATDKGYSLSYGTS